MGESAPSVILRRPRAPRDVVVEQELIDLLAERSPLTVVRGPRGYGKTTLVDAWLSRSAPDPATVYLRLTRACNDGPTFWDGVARALQASGVLELPDGADPHQEVLNQLSVRTEPLTLIVDDYHHAGRRDVAAEIDDELVELVRQNDQLFLVVATRTIRVLETTGSLSIDVAIISPQELRLSPGGVAALAARTGVPIGDAQATRLAVGFGGWPAAIRDVLVRSRWDGGHINLALADQYIATMVRDLRHEAVRTFMLRTAVPEEFDAELAQLVAPSEKVLAILRNVRSQGLIHEEIREERRVYSYAPLVRQALVRVLTESRPAQLREVHGTLMDWHIKGGDHVRAIVHAIHAGEWATVEALMEEHWPHLITQEPWALVSAAQLIPPEIAAAHPRLRVAREELAQALPPGTARPSVPPWPTGDLRGITAELRLRPAGATPGATTLALLQWGVAAVMAGDLATALYAFGRTRDLGQETDDDGALVPATAGLALTHALLGDVDIARGWLADRSVAGIGQGPDEDEDLVGVGVRIARALVALDGLDEGLDDVVGVMGERHRRDEIWALTVYVRAAHAGLSGVPGEVARWAANLRAARHYLPRGGLAEMLVRSGLVETLVTGGMLVAARQAAEDVQASVVSFSTLARLSLADGDPARAVAHARTGLAHPRLSQRSVMECHLVLAGAHHALGERVAARRAFDLAIESAHGSGQRRPLLTMRYSTFLQLAGGDQTVLDLWPARLRPSTEEGPDLGAVRPAEPLSRRERQVLDSLARNAGAVGIARELGLSVNTVKTHLRAVYRKLGVGSRDEALIAGSSRGVVLPGVATWAQG